MKIELGEINRVCGGSLDGHELIQGMWIEPGAVKKVAGIMEKENWAEPVIICDQNTYLLGDTLLENLENYHIICLDPEGLAADERSVSLAKNKIPETADCMIAFGSVTIHDITRYLCWQYGLPFISVPTAASGEGYTTCVSAVVRDGVKRNIMAVAPTYLFADTDIFASAPERLTAAGFSDLMGNYIALADWKISELFTDISVNHRLCEIELDAMRQVIDQVEALTAGDGQICEKLLYALILPDMVMGNVPGTRPLMGAEHHLSRYLDISVDQPKLNAVHGEKVGVGMLLCLKNYEIFRNALKEGRLEPADIQGLAGKEIRKGFWKSEVREAVLELNRPDPLKGITGEKVLEKKSELIRILEQLPSVEKIEEAFQKMGCKMLIEELGMTDDMIRLAMKYSPYVSSDITLLRIEKLFKEFV